MKIVRSYKVLTSDIRFFQTNSIIYVWEGSNYAPLAVSFSCILTKVTLKTYVFIKISQISVETKCVGKHLHCRHSGLQLHKNETSTQIFCCKIFKNTYFYRTAAVTHWFGKTFACQKPIPIERFCNRFRKNSPLPEIWSKHWQLCCSFALSINLLGALLHTP